VPSKIRSPELSDDLQPLLHPRLSGEAVEEAGL